MQKIFFVFLILLTSLWSSDEPIECQQQNVLAKYAGHYTDKELWNNIPKERNWASTRGRSHNGIINADLNEHGIVTVYTNWHEGSTESSCNRIINNELWIFDNEIKDWGGPFTHVGKAFDENTIYFKRLFQHKCYTDESNKKWCFGNSEIKIDNKKFKVELMLDTFETPLYGSALKLEENTSRLWMIVPYKNGWKVFQDTWASDENRKEINPLTDKPWHILK